MQPISPFSRTLRRRHLDRKKIETSFSSDSVLNCEIRKPEINPFFSSPNYHHRDRDQNGQHVCLKCRRAIFPHSFPVDDEAIFPARVASICARTEDLFVWHYDNPNFTHYWLFCFGTEKCPPNYRVFSGWNDWKTISHERKPMVRVMSNSDISIVIKKEWIDDCVWYQLIMKDKLDHLSEVDQQGISPFLKFWMFHSLRIFPINL